MDLVVERSRESSTTRPPARSASTPAASSSSRNTTRWRDRQGGIGYAPHGRKHPALHGDRRLALKETFGTDGQPGSTTSTTDAILHVGHNMAETQTVLWARARPARGPDPPSSIVIDPRDRRRRGGGRPPRDPTGHERGGAERASASADRAGGIDRAYIDAHTVGFETLEETVAAYTPERVAEICGIRADDYAARRRSSAEAERLLTSCSRASTSRTRRLPPRAR